MTDELRRPLFFVALVALVLVVLVDLGSGAVLGGDQVGAGLVAQAQDLGVTLDLASAESPPGRGITALGLVDLALLYTVVLIGAGILVPARVQGRIQGIATLVFSILLLIAVVVLAVVTIVELTLMVALFLSAPFGTLAYLVVWGFFPVGESAVLLGLIMVLKLVFAVLLVLAHPRFLQNRGLVVLVVVSLVCTLLVSFLHGVVPGIVVSIADDIGALVVTIVAGILAVVFLIGSIPAVLRALRA